jgi:hypothetical protein
MSCKHLHRFVITTHPYKPGVLLGTCSCGARKEYPAYVDIGYNRCLDEGKLAQEEFYNVSSAESIIFNPSLR